MILRVRDIQAGRRSHRCTECKRSLPIGDPKWETAILEFAIQTTYVRSVYCCRTCRKQPRR